MLSLIYLRFDGINGCCIPFIDVDSHCVGLCADCTHDFQLHIKNNNIYFLPLLRFAAVLPTNDQVPIENVIVAESGDDSDDEWNYIKVDKSTTKSDKASPEPERIEEAEDSKPVLEDSVEDTATPPTASIGEPDIIASQVLEDTDVSIHTDGRPQLTLLFYLMVCNFVFFFSSCTTKSKRRNASI